MIKNAQTTKTHLYSQSPGNIVSDMDGEKVMLSVQNGKYYNLGELGGEIWELIKEPLTMQELVTLLLSRYNVNPAECEEQVISFLNQLKSEGLINIQEYRIQSIPSSNY